MIGKAEVELPETMPVRTVKEAIHDHSNRAVQLMQMLSSCNVHTLSVTVPAHTWRPDIAHKLFHTRDCSVLIKTLYCQPQRAYQQQQA